MCFFFLREVEVVDGTFPSPSDYAAENNDNSAKKGEKDLFRAKDKKKRRF